jgi:RNA polymerase sigma factor (TIGR02999 family)
MADISQLLEASERGDPLAAEALLPVVYDELRKLAAVRLGQERPGQTLYATDLVHEAYLRLVGAPQEGPAVAWQGRGHFFAAAGEAMRRILVENARRRKSAKRGGGLARCDLDESSVANPEDSDLVLAVNDALDGLAAVDPQAADLVKLRYYAGLTVAEAAVALGVSPRTADRVWAYAKSWIHAAISG